MWGDDIEDVQRGQHVETTDGADVGPDCGARATHLIVLKEIQVSLVVTHVERVVPRHQLEAQSRRRPVAWKRARQRGYPGWLGRV